MVRVGPGSADDALSQPHTRVFDMTGRPMKGWILVAHGGLADDEALASWVRRGGLAAAQGLSGSQQAPLVDETIGRCRNRRSAYGCSAAWTFGSATSGCRRSTPRARSRC